MLKACYENRLKTWSHCGRKLNGRKLAECIVRSQASVDKWRNL